MIVALLNYWNRVVRVVLVEVFVLLVFKNRSHSQFLVVLGIHEVLMRHRSVVREHRVSFELKNLIFG